MKYKKPIFKIGSSHAVRVPMKLMDKEGLEAGDQVDVVLKKAKR